MFSETSSPSSKVTLAFCERLFCFESGSWRLLIFCSGLSLAFFYERCNASSSRGDTLSRWDLLRADLEEFSIFTMDWLILISKLCLGMEFQDLFRLAAFSFLLSCTPF